MIVAVLVLAATKRFPRCRPLSNLLPIRGKQFFQDIVNELGFEICGDLDSLVERADIVTIHVPYLPSTHHLMDSSRIRHMKQGAILINTSRGDIVDGRALLESLREGRIAGVGLDVFHDEPPKEDWEKELVALKDGRSVCTPHVGAQTLECQRLESVTVAKEIIKLLGG
ncbi:MAG: NAD(P)-dependent oxidoreductase [Candidatus Bathyarchaeia archaeon]